jgi:hypothetical protein
MSKTIPNSPILKVWLARKPELADLGRRESFTFEDALFERTAHFVAAHHPQMNQASVEIRAALQLLTTGHPGATNEPETQGEIVVDSLEVRLPSWVRKWAIAVLILLGVIAFAAIAKAQTIRRNSSMAGQGPVELIFNTTTPGTPAAIGSVANPYPVSEAVAAQALLYRQVEIFQRQSLLSQSLQLQMAQSGGFIPAPEIPEFLGAI